ncbi:molybdopterin-dependent oxidoreductase [Paraflavitalea sp. CAU 1676]|uniref:molybdopterin-dependent oxidoreductase n=1 Tax=Paraflavitalea sp. CAU 1676 TaxID=3032598 RepID=UPI0023DA3F21|nr:molybdopterin-dependent oxidoreductase [Paraflavitalea sp. CAU 1676]MDF2189869.1 molybdopterin-dependent oxidoreductase [Paraflavitalea sp. CAU 1676]
MKTRLFFLLLSTCLLTKAAWTQNKDNPVALAINGEVKAPTKITAAEILGMKQTPAMLKDRDGKEHTYTGVPIQDLLNKAGVTTGKQLHGENLAKYLLVKCADGYEVVFSLAELDNEFTDRQVILAHQVDGGPLPSGKGPFRLVVPGEKRPARSCFQVVEMVVRFAKD